MAVNPRNVANVARGTTYAATGGLAGLLAGGPVGGLVGTAFGAGTGAVRSAIERRKIKKEAAMAKKNINKGSVALQPGG